MDKKKPLFRRKESNKKSRLGRGRKKKLKWRRQKGKHSKIRTRMKSYMRCPSIGYGADRKTRGMIHGINPIIVRNLQDLNSIEAKAIIIAHTSKKNKIAIAKKAQEKNIKILNLKNEFLKSIKEKKEEKQEKKQDIIKSKQSN